MDGGCYDRVASTILCCTMVTGLAVGFIMMAMGTKIKVSTPVNCKLATFTIHSQYHSFAISRLARWCRSSQSPSRSVQITPLALSHGGCFLPGFLIPFSSMLLKMKNLYFPSLVLQQGRVITRLVFYQLEQRGHWAVRTVSHKLPCCNSPRSWPAAVVPSSRKA